MDTNRSLQKFLDFDIFDTEEEQADLFFSQYDEQKIVHALSKCLLSYHRCSNEDLEDAWRLGRKFGNLSNNFSIDIEIVKLAAKENGPVRRVLYAFLSGFYDQADSNIGAVIDLGRNIIILLGSEGVSKEIVYGAIEAFALGYLNNLKLFKNNPLIDKKAKEMLAVFKVTASEAPTDNPAYQLLVK